MQASHLVSLVEDPFLLGVPEDIAAVPWTVISKAIKDVVVEVLSRGRIGKIAAFPQQMAKMVEKSSLDLVA